MVPARGGSKGVPNKNLKTVHGIPISEWAIMVARKFDGGHIALSSDSEEILSIARKYQGVISVKRPDEISNDKATDQEALKHCLAFCEELLGVPFKTVVMLQPTAPSRSVEIVRACLDTKSREGASAVWTVDEVDVKLHAYKQLMQVGEVAALVVDSKRPFRRQDLTPSYARNGECYALSRDVVLNDPLLLGPNARLIISPPGSVNIDTVEDFDRAEKTLKVGEHGNLVRHE